MITRRFILFGAIWPAVAAGFAAATGRSAVAAPMIPKKLAEYRDRPDAGHDCAACCMFVPGHPARCTMIEGIISPQGWCRYWQAGPADTCN